MKKSKTVLNKLFLSLVLTIIMLSSGMVVFAAGGPQLTTLQVGKRNGAKFSVVKNVTLYTNGNTSASNGVVVEGCTTTPKEIILDVNAISGAGKYLLSSQNQRVAKVSRDSDNKIKITAGNETGKTNIILTDRYNLKKQAKVTVTVKTLVDEITFGSNVKNGQINIAEKGSLPLNAIVNADASSKKLTYKVIEQSPNSVVKVNSKGIITGLKSGTAKIVVTATDQKTNKTKSTGYSTSIKVVVSPAKVKSMNILSPVKDKETGKYPTIEMKTNKYNSMHTFRIIAEAYGTAYPEGKRIANGVIYTSSKPSVVSVDSNGLVTANGNGKAKITITPAEGTKLSKALTLNVNVTTDMEDFNVPDDVKVLIGKSIKITPSMDSMVSNKKLKFDLSSSKAADGSNNATVSLSSNGTIKGMKEGTAVITVENEPDKNGKKIVKTCRVTVVNPVKSISATVTSLDKDGNEIDAKTSTLYINDNLHKDDQAFDKAKIKVDISFLKDSRLSQEAAIDYANVDVSSSHWCVDVVREGAYFYLVPNYPGKATITIAAFDGSGKKAKVAVTVKAKVSNIWLNSEGTHTNISGVTKECIYVPEGGFFDLQEYVNYDASNKKVSFALKDADGVILNNKRITAKKSADDELMEAGTLVVSANDATSSPKQRAFSKEYLILIVQKSSSDKLNSILNGRTFKIEVGSMDFTPYIYGDLGQELKLEWSSSNLKVVTVNAKGIATFKGIGDAVITVKDSKTSKTVESKIRVVESNQDFQNGLNDKIEYLINSGDYRFLGLKPNYNKKYPTSINFLLVDGNTIDHEYGSSIKEDFNSLLDMFIDLFADPSYRSITISNWNDAINYVVERDGAGFKLSVFDDYNVLVKTESYETPNEATRALASAMTADYKTAYDYRDKSFNIDLVKIDQESGYEDAEYYAYYYAYFQYDYNDVMAYYDNLIKKQIDVFESNTEASGIGGIDFSEKNKTVTINIAEASKNVENSADIMKDSYVYALKEILKDSKEISIDVNGEEKTFYSSYYTEYGEETFDSYIERLYAEIVGNLNAENVTTLNMLENVTIDFTLKRYDYMYINYCVEFRRTASAIDKMLDKKIKADVERLNGRPNKDVLGSVYYNSDTNELSVEVIDPEYEILDMGGTGLGEIVNTILSDESAESARFISAGKKNFTDIERNSDGKLSITKGSLYWHFINYERTMGELIDRALYIEVNYGDNKTIVYTFYFIEGSSGTVQKSVEGENTKDFLETEAENMEEMDVDKENIIEGDTEEPSEEKKDISELIEETDEAVIEDSLEEYEKSGEVEIEEDPEIKGETEESETELTFVAERDIS